MIGEAIHDRFFKKRINSFSQFHGHKGKKESIETPLGTYEAYKVSRKFEEESTRSQIFWLAPDLDFSVIKIYDKNDREVEIKIKNFEEIG